MTGASALAATAILLGLACLQAQLVVGRPLGRFAWGGAHEVLPPGQQVASTLSIVLYGAIALVLLDAADVVDALRGRWTATAAWVLAGFFLLVAAMNAASRSRDERRMGTPVALALCLLCVAMPLMRERARPGLHVLADRADAPAGTFARECLRGAAPRDAEQRDDTIRPGVGRCCLEAQAVAR